jgi:hypothetical protein
MSQASTGLGKLGRNAGNKENRSLCKAGLDDLVPTSKAIKKIIKFKHLQDRGIVNSWQQLKNLIDNNNFPSGFYLGSNSRVWFETDVVEWLDNRPTDRRDAEEEAEEAAT